MNAVYRAEFRGRLHSAVPEFIRNKIPLPCRGELIVVVKNQKDEPVRVPVPFLIWPSFKTVIVSGLLTVILTYVLPQLMSRAGGAGDPAAAAWELISDPLFLVRVAGFTAAATVGLHVLGSLLVLTGLVGEDG